jgi:hypothetical protein
MNNLDIIPLRNNLLIDFKYNDIKIKIISRLTELNLHQVQYRLDNEFLTLLCNLIEHLVIKKDKINKKELAIIIMSELFTLTEEEKKAVSNNIEFLFGNKMIKKVSYYKLFKTGIKEYFRKKG